MALNRKNIKKLAEFLRKQKSLPFDKEEHNYHRAEGFSLQCVQHKCGTPSCIEGYAACLEAGTDTVPVYSGELTRKFLGLNARQFQQLCYPNAVGIAVKKGRPNFPYDATAEEAAQVLDHFAKVGYVAWSIVLENEESKAETIDWASVSEGSIVDYLKESNE